MKKSLPIIIIALTAVAIFVAGFFIGKSQNNPAETTASTETAKTAETAKSAEATSENSAPDGTPVKAHGKLTVDGATLKDQNGEKFQLRGVSTHGLAWFPQYVNADAFRTMRDSWGINTVRLAMYTDPSAGYSESIHEKVKEGVKYATDLGLYVIIDWHILSDYNPNMHKSEALKFFREMAGLYKDNLSVLYEICNEPNGDAEWSRDIKPYAEELISAIRTIDDDAIILVGSSTWSQDIDKVAENPLSGVSNVMYTVHFYAATHKDWLRNKVSAALDKGIPVFISEFGISDASGNGALDYSEAGQWLSLLNSRGVSFVIWNLSNKNESSALLTPENSKTSGWAHSDLSPQGQWFVDTAMKS
ncbi:glycoside hydrolase family 5 protein [Candidatus Saccharibacteria bacterium]|nr:glycoside hydrolase family 5 protein [Candidatus Saccharibacteria bacterium]